MIEKSSGYRDAAADGGSSQLLVASRPANLAFTQASISDLATPTLPRGLRRGRSGKIRSYRPGKDREPPRRCFSVVSFGR
jgi:hypothetical protein